MTPSSLLSISHDDGDNDGSPGFYPQIVGRQMANAAEDNLRFIREEPVLPRAFVC